LAYSVANVPGIGKITSVTNTGLVVSTLFANYLGNYGGLITVNNASTAVTISASFSAYKLVGRVLYTSAGVFIGRVASASSTTACTLAANYTGTSLSNATYTYSTAITLTTAGNTITVASASTAVTVAGTPSAFALVGRALYTNTGLVVGTVLSASSATACVLTAPTLNAVAVAATYYYSTNINATRVPTRFTETLYSGSTIGLSVSPLQYPANSTTNIRVSDVVNDNYVQSVNASSGIGSSINSAITIYPVMPIPYVVSYSYEEQPMYDVGETAYINNDWQSLGSQNGTINDLITTQTGDIIASGTFTSWSDKSDSTSATPRSVYRTARIVPLIADGIVTNAYATPFVGTSYTRNGVNYPVNAVADITDINPVSGYVGSGNRLLMGGSFTKTMDSETLSNGLAYVEGSTISGNLQTIVSTEIQLPTSASVTKIGYTNRMRVYSSTPMTNILDGINGSNIAIITSSGQATALMQYYSVRVRGNASTYPVITIVNLGTHRTLYELYQTDTGARIRFLNNGVSVLAYETITINCQPGRRSISSDIRGNLISYIHPTTNLVDWVLLGANNSAGVSTQSYDDYRTNVIGVLAQTGLSISISYTPRFWSFDANNIFFGTTKAGV
jgi:hypothetical protein